MKEELKMGKIISLVMVMMIILSLSACSVSEPVETGETSKTKPETIKITPENFDDYFNVSFECSDPDDLYVEGLLLGSFFDLTIKIYQVKSGALDNVKATLSIDFPGFYWELVKDDPNYIETEDRDLKYCHIDTTILLPVNGSWSESHHFCQSFWAGKKIEASSVQYKVTAASGTIKASA